MKNTYNADYKPFWEQYRDPKTYQGDFAKMHEALEGFEGWLEEQDKKGAPVDDMDFMREIFCMIETMQLKSGKEWTINHMDNVRSPKKYYFVWDAGNIIWEFPGDLHGSIWI